MASRRITDYLFTGGIDTLEDGSLEKIDPTLIVVLHKYSNPKLLGYTCFTMIIEHRETPTLLQMQSIISAASPILAKNKKVLVLCNDGSQRSCSIASIVLAHTNKEPVTKTIDRLCKQFQTPAQGMHTWYPYKHWLDSITKQWLHLKDTKV